MNKALIIVPYYGKLPPYFSMWIKTCKNNSQLNWLIVSDDENKHIEKELPPNVSFLSISFTSLKQRVEGLIGFEFEHFTPYRLCDCRPLFGMLFESQIENYDFWGWCDMDLLFGDLSKYLITERLSHNDKIYTNGHLSLVKNSEKVRFITRDMLNDEKVINIFKSKYPEGFDERYFNVILKNSKLEIFDEKECIDINPRFYEFRNVNKNNDKVKVQYKNGKILDDYNNEYPYVHFQKRSFENNKIDSDIFYIGECGFTEINKSLGQVSMFAKNAKFYFYFLIKHLIPQHINRIKVISGK